MVGLVLVSHSALIAEGTAQLARQMAGDAAIATAGGIDDPADPIGTDATRVLAAIEEVWSDDGVVVLMDLGSAILSADFALDLLEPDRRERVVLCEAPLVEGAVAAATAAGAGASLQAVLAEARAALASKAAALGVDTPAAAVAPEATAAGDQPGDDTVTAVLEVGNPTGLHARPAARFVATVARFDASVTVSNDTTGAGPVRGDSFSAIGTLGARRGHRVRVTAAGHDSAAVVEALRDLATAGFGDEPAATAPSAPAVPSGGSVGASPGTVVGPARHWRAVDLDQVDGGPVGSLAAERDRLAVALAAVADTIRESRRLARSRAGEAAAGIFDAHLLLVEDAALLDAVAAGIDAGNGAVASWRGAIAELAGRFRRLEDEYQAGRAADVEAVGNDVLAAMLGVDAAPEPSGVGILVAPDLDPGQTARLDSAVTTGILTAAGGPTSHAAILARSLGIPAVVAAGPRVLDIAEGSTVLIDGTTGEVVVDPDPERVQSAAVAVEAQRREAQLAAASAHLPAVTEDGTTIEVAANVGSVSDAVAAMAAGADGVGLLRTEFVFLGRDTAPTEAEQEEMYRAVAEAMAGRRVVIRTLDVGGDKPLPFVAQPHEVNPFLGVRGLRLGLRDRSLLATQLRAVVRVAADCPVAVMFPMVTTVAEILEARRMVDEAIAGAGITPSPQLEVGVMVEVPALAVLADRVAPHVDFFSVGTNDLTQYVLAAERGHPGLAAMADPLHPAVLRLIGGVCRAASATGAWVGVCGEAAGDVAAVPVLLGLGVRELSVGPAAIAAVKQAVRQVDLREAADLARTVADADGAPDVRALLNP